MGKSRGSNFRPVQRTAVAQKEGKDAPPNVVSAIKRDEVGAEVDEKGQLFLFKKGAKAY